LIHVVLDTNIYRKCPSRDNLNFKAIEKLSIAKWVLLHIPYVVEREFQTQQREIYEKDLKKAVSGLAGLERKQLSPEILEKIKKLRDDLDKDYKSILSDAELQFINWAKNIGANRLPLCLDQANLALEAYFQGKPPLTNAKVRDDIPDSFIVQAINKLQVANGKIHVVAEDKKIRKAFTSNESIYIYESLAKFMGSEIIQNELKDLDLVDNLEEIGKSLEEFEKDCGEITETIKDEIGDKLVGSTIYDESIPDDNSEATIYSFWEPEDIELDFEDLAYYGNGHIGIPFNLRILVNGVYYIFKSDYYAMDYEEGKRPSVTDHNDHYFEAEDEFELFVEGVVSLTVDRENINLNNLSECLHSHSISVDEIKKITLC